VIDRLLTTSAVLLLSQLLSTCTSCFAQPDVAAVIDKPTKESRAELAQAVSSALNGAPVTLADDALTQDSLLIIERAHPRDASGVPLSGRDLDKPEHFRLGQNGKVLRARARAHRQAHDARFSNLPAEVSSQRTSTQVSARVRCRVGDGLCDALDPRHK